MRLISLLLVHGASAVIVNSGPCLLAATTAKTCCDNPLSDACVDEPMKALNDKLSRYQDKLGRRTAGLRDATADARERAEALRNSAALNLLTAEHCEQLTKTCLDACATFEGAEVTAAVARCNESKKLIQDTREKAARDEAQAKRAARGLK